MTGSTADEVPNMSFIIITASTGMDKGKSETECVTKTALLIKLVIKYCFTTS